MALLASGYDSRAVANEILAIAKAKGLRLTIMQLVKLIYFAQGWSLAYWDRPITSDQAQAWQYGPVYPTVYKAFQGAGSRVIEGPILRKADGKPFTAAFSAEEQDMLEWVVDTYGKMHAFQLSQLTHVDGSPWQKASQAGGYYSPIPDSLLNTYFKGFIGDHAG